MVLSLALIYCIEWQKKSIVRLLYKLASNYDSMYSDHAESNNRPEMAICWSISRVPRTMSSYVTPIEHLSCHTKH